MEGAEKSMHEQCFDDDVSAQRCGEERVCTWGFTSRVLIACACVVDDARPAFAMDEMEGGRGPCEYFQDWFHFAESKTRALRKAGGGTLIRY